MLVLRVLTKRSRIPLRYINMETGDKELKSNSKYGNSSNEANDSNLIFSNMIEILT